MTIRGKIPVSPLKEQDVVVVGAGAAGLPAAMAAKEAGAKVTVLEWAPNLKDSNLARAGGAVSRAPELDVGHPTGKTSIEERVKKAVDAGEGRCDGELIRIVLTYIERDMDWLKNLGFEWMEHGSLYTDRVAVGRLSQARGVGFGFNNQMRKIAEKMGCRVLMNTRGKELITNQKGKVIGIRTMTEEGYKDFDAGAVILASSGYQANMEMLARYHDAETLRRIRLTGSPYSMGDGHIMAEQIGAKMVGMEQLEFRTIDKTWRPGSPGQMGPFRHLNVTARYAIFLNKNGQRFVDENEENDVIGGAIMGQPEGVSTWVWDEKARQKAPLDEVARYERTRPGVIIKANTLEELAPKIDIPYDKLKRTIDDYNAAIQEEKTVETEIPKIACAIKIDTPPFYAIYPVWGGLNCTMGGPKITPNGEVIDMEDKPIPGLYAAGEMIGGFFYSRWYTTPSGIITRKSNVFIAGALLPMCLVLGRIAGTNAAKYATSKKELK